MNVAVRTTDLSRAFGSVRAVDGLAMEVPAGEVYGFLGRNGAGKTTTLRMLIGILRPDRGTLEVLGQVGQRVTVSLKRQLGYVSQEQTFYPWMTTEDLGAFVGRFYPTWDGAYFKRLATQFQVPLERKAGHLSTGTQAKLALALALAHRPPLLLLDEPTAGLDPVARREFLDVPSSEARASGQTVIFSSHLVGEVEQVADSIGILQAGRLRYQGPLALLRASVRRIDWGQAAELVLPPEFERLRDEALGVGRSSVFRASPELWISVPLASEQMHPLSLEDIFLAYARTDSTPP